MLAYTYLGRGDLRLLEKPKPALLEDRDAVVRVTLSSICTSDLHIKHGSVPRAAPTPSSRRRAPRTPSAWPGSAPGPTPW